MNKIVLLVGSLTPAPWVALSATAEIRAPPLPANRTAPAAAA